MAIDEHETFFIPDPRVGVAVHFKNLAMAIMFRIGEAEPRKIKMLLIDVPPVCFGPGIPRINRYSQPLHRQTFCPPRCPLMRGQKWWEDRIPIVAGVGAPRCADCRQPATIGWGFNRNPPLCGDCYRVGLHDAIVLSPGEFTELDPYTQASEVC